jgi:hypothetical protein
LVMATLLRQSENMAFHATCGIRDRSTTIAAIIAGLRRIREM